MTKVTKEITKKFKPQFSGSRPTPEVTLPTYQRQLVYLERVLNELIDDVNENFSSYDDYIVSKMSEIKDSVNEYIEQLTEDKINEEVSEAIEREISEIISSIDDVREDLMKLKIDVIENSGDIEEANESLLKVRGELDVITEALGDLRVELTKDISEGIDESKSYTDIKIKEVEESILESSLTNDDVSEIIAEDTAEIRETVNKIDETQSVQSDQIKGIVEALEDTPGVVLEKRVTDVEHDVIRLDSRIDTIEDLSAPDLSEIKENIIENSEAVASLKVEVDSHSSDIDEAYELSTKASEEVAVLRDEVDVLSTKVDKVPEDIESTLDGFESTIANSTNQVGELNIKVDNLESEELPKRVSNIEKFMDVTSNEFIEFTPGADSQSNVLFKVSQNEAGISVYKGSLAFDVKGEFSTYDSLVIEGLKTPLNVKNEVTGKSQFINKPTISYSTDELSGVALDGELEVVNEVIKIKSNKLSKFVESNSSETVDVVIDLTLIFDGNFSVLE